MIALPRYVRANRKANGRVYYSFAKYRGTPQAWPPVPLPSDPGSADFVSRVALCERIDAVKDKDTWAWRFNDVSGRRHDLPAPNIAGFWPAIDKAHEIGRKLAASDGKTFSALIIDFKNHTAYTEDIGDGMREQYDRYLKLIDAAWGDDPVASLDAEQAQKAIDSYQDTPAAARLFRATLHRLVKWGIPRGYAKVNAIRDTERIDSDGTYDPWPPEAFELFFGEARADLHLPVYSALFTGQRKVDVLQMLRPAVGATEMPLVAQKTDQLVPVQIHSEYRGLINAAAPKDSGHVVELRETPQLLHLRADGQPWTYEGFKTAWGREVDRAVLKPFREHRWVPHGLRKNAVNMLLEVGCSEAQVSAIVGMSLAMVQHYSLKVNRFRLGRSAMKVLEGAWSEHRVHVLGNVKRLG